MKNLKTLSNEIELLTSLNLAQQITVVLFIPLAIVLIYQAFISTLPFQL